MRNLGSWCALIIVVCACCLPAGRPEPQCQGHGPPSSLPSSRAQAVCGMHPDGPRAAPTGAAAGRVAACRHCSQQGLSLNLPTVQCVRQPSPAHATAAGSRGLRGSPPPGFCPFWRVLLLLCCGARAHCSIAHRYQQLRLHRVSQRQPLLGVSICLCRPA